MLSPGFHCQPCKLVCKSGIHLFSATCKKTNNTIGIGIEVQGRHLPPQKITMLPQNLLRALEKHRLN